jgi:hypothetical protein
VLLPYTAMSTMWSVRLGTLAQTLAVCRFQVLHCLCTTLVVSFPFVQHDGLER